MEGVAFSFSQYVTQTVLHSIVILLVIEISLNVWEVRSPAGRFRYRIQTLFLPMLMYPMFQVLDPSRGSVYFITDRALFNSSTWLSIRLWEVLPLSILFGSILALTAGVTLVQEILPVIQKMLRWETGSPGFSSPPPDLEKKVEEMSNRMGIPSPSIRVLDDAEPFLFVEGTRYPVIIVTRGVLNDFSERELNNALVHELAHILRRSTSITLLAFLARMLMFYNPVSLLVFRRLIQDDEQVCDDLTVSVTEDPEGLASALKTFYFEEPEKAQPGYSSMIDFISTSSHNLLLQERISRLQAAGRETSRPAIGEFVITVVSVSVLCYFIV